jgi:hypothetical protein
MMDFLGVLKAAAHARPCEQWRHRAIDGARKAGLPIDQPAPTN